MSLRIRTLLLYIAHKAVAEAIYGLWFALSTENLVTLG